MTQPDLELYPHAPGFQDTDTSRAAAAAVKPKDKPIRQRVMDSLLEVGPATADEMAKRLGLHPRNVVPRVSQLHKLGKVADSGHRRQSDLGNPAIVWRLA